MSYEEPTTENLSADEKKLREMCLSLKKVAAPKDFDFKLKARLADSKTSDFRPRFGIAFRYAMPALALVLVLGLLAYTGSFWPAPGGNNIAAEAPAPAPAVQPLPENAAVSNSSVAQQKEDPAENPPVAPVEQPAPRTPENEIIARRPAEPKKDARRDPKDAGGGSKDFSSTVDRTKQPRFEPPVLVPKNSTAADKNSIPVKEILSMMGINAAFENRKWTVKSTTANGVAEASGVKADDVVEAVDNQSLSGETGEVKSATWKTLTVTRGGEKITIKLQKKQ